ncbi:MAG TPA: DUF1499 domain-containing protein [Candidatus Dormibacteraeota bacterium]|nr:DUF1499 domain-containing protein [Candidatus Dormibacteraeota bacterium]
MFFVVLDVTRSSMTPARTAYCLAALALLVGCAAEREPMMPSPAEPLAPCPASPNCVSSLATDDAHRVAPLAYQGDPAAAMRRLRAVIEAMPRARVVGADDTALHAEFTSFLFRFVDDVNCAVDAEASVIQIRSASRVGYSDLGVNRKRVEAIRAAFEK